MPVAHDVACPLVSQLNLGVMEHSSEEQKASVGLSEVRVVFFDHSRGHVDSVEVFDLCTRLVNFEFSTYLAPCLCLA